MPQPKSINLLVLCQPSRISVKHPAQNFLSIARKLDLRTQVLKQLGQGGQEEEFARSLPYTLALRIRVCLEKRKACETDATPCVCLLSPFKSYITNFFHTENCIYPLGLESGEITDEALTHSVDTTRTVSDPSGIRLNKNPGGFPNGWQAAMGTLDYIQVEKSWVNLATLICL